MMKHRTKQQGHCQAVASKAHARKTRAQRVVQATVMAIMAAGLAAELEAAPAQEKKLEKCYGIVKKGMNDCGAHDHSCQGAAKQDNDPKEWIFLPTGTCQKITGGSTTPKE